MKKLVICSMLLLGFATALASRIDLKDLQDPVKKKNYRCIGVKEITLYNCVTAECDSSPDYGAFCRVAVNGVPLGKTYACNFLPFNTKIVIPKLTGDTVWTNKDRTAKKCGHRIDLLLNIGQTIGLRKAEVFIVCPKKN